MTVHKTTQGPSLDDGQLVDQVRSALVDPDLNTDTRMRLRREISDVLRGAHEELHGPKGAEAHEQLVEAHDHHLQKVLRDVLVDPELPTALRIRLHNEIPEILRAARKDSARQTEQH